MDFDLRRPSIDRIFNLQPSPGVIEMLRGEAELHDAVQSHPSASNLSVLAAGKWDPNIVTKLSNGAVGTLFDELRGNFDYVVVDSCPLLPVADAPTCASTPTR